MKLEGPAVLRALSGEDSIRDATILSVEIGVDAEMAFVRILLSARTGSQYATVALTFREIVEYSFYDSGVWGGHAVSHLKFLVDEEGAYIALDPYDESSKQPADEDNYFVQAGTVEAVLTRR